MVNSTTKNASLSEDFSIVFLLPFLLSANFSCTEYANGSSWCHAIYIDGCGCMTVKSINVLLDFY
jgi:hypothetical protein